AVTPRQREQGLMNRREMAPDHGMLFAFGETRQVFMWMKNTYLPLDMLFIGKDGKIRSIKENARPLDESIIDSKGPIDYVLELNGGTVKRLGIRTGNRVQNALMEKLRKGYGPQPKRTSPIRAEKLALCCCGGGAIRVSPHRRNGRSVAQSGSASGLGPEGREFESLHSDHRQKPRKQAFLRGLSIPRIISCESSVICEWVAVMAVPGAARATRQKPLTLHGPAAIARTLRRRVPQVERRSLTRMNGRHQVRALRAGAWRAFRW